MGNPRSSKRSLEKARQERSAAKRDRRQGRAGEGEGEGVSEDAPGLPTMSEGQVIEALAALQAQYAAEAITFEEFDERRSELMARIDVQ